MATVREQLERWEQSVGLTPRQAAERLGYSFKMYEAIKYGARRPRLSRMLEFQEKTGVPASLLYPELEGLL